MLLLIDVGNTNTVFALYRERKQLGQWRLSTNRERTAEEYGALLIQLIQIAGFDHRQVAAVIISSVVPPALQPLRWMSEGFFGCKAFVTGEDLEHGIVNKAEQTLTYNMPDGDQIMIEPDELHDRWAAIFHTLLQRVCEDIEHRSVL